MVGLFYVAALFVFASPSFQDSFYPRMDQTVKLALRVDRHEPVYPSQGRYLENIKPIYWEAPRAKISRIAPGQTPPTKAAAVESVVSVDSSQNQVENQGTNGSSDNLAQEDNDEFSGYEELGIVNSHQAPTRINVDDILTYFKNSNKTEGDASFTVPNENRPLQKQLPTRDLPNLQ